MKVRLLLVVVLVSLSLPCIELPEWAGIFDDVSNDFIVVPSRVERPVCARSLRAPHFAALFSQARTVLTVFPSPLLNAPIRSGARSVLNIISVQKK
jgi:hypothetical protein